MIVTIVERQNNQSTFPKIAGYSQLLLSFKKLKKILIIMMVLGKAHYAVRRTGALEPHK